MIICVWCYFFFIIFILINIYIYILCIMISCIYNYRILFNFLWIVLVWTNLLCLLIMTCMLCYHFLLHFFISFHSCRYESILACVICYFSSYHFLFLFHYVHVVMNCFFWYMLYCIIFIDFFSFLRCAYEHDACDFSGMSFILMSLILVRLVNDIDFSSVIN
jgi:hypothetical protein